MPEAVTIAPMGRQPGLVASECPKCTYVTSVLALRATSHPTTRRRTRPRQFHRRPRRRGDRGGTACGGAYVASGHFSDFGQMSDVNSAK
jgi:hypothetical protein